MVLFDLHLFIAIPAFAFCDSKTVVPTQYDVLECGKEAYINQVKRKSSHNVSRASCFTITAI